MNNKFSEMINDGTDKLLKSERPFLLVGYRLAIFFALFASSLLTYSGLVKTLNIGTEIISNSAICFIIVVAVFLFQIVFWNSLLNQSISHPYIFGSHNYVIPFEIENAKERFFVGSVFLLVLVVFSFFASTHFSIVALGGDVALKNELKNITHDMEKHTTEVFSEITNLKTKALPALESFEGRINEVVQYEARVSPEEGAIRRTGTVLGNELNEVKQIIRGIGTSGADGLINTVNNFSLVDNERFDKVIISKRKELGHIKNQIISFNSVLNEIKARLDNIAITTEDAIELIKEKAIVVSSEGYRDRLTQTGDIYMAEKNRINAISDGISSVSAAKDKDIIQIRIDNPSSLVYRHFSSIFDRFAIALLLDFWAIIPLTVYFSLYMWNIKKQQQASAKRHSESAIPGDALS